MSPVLPLSNLGYYFIKAAAPAVDAGAVDLYIFNAIKKSRSTTSCLCAWHAVSDAAVTMEEHEGTSTMARQPKLGRGDNDPPPSAGYPSAYDIPDFRKMRDDMAAMRLLLFLKPSLRRQFKEQKQNFEQIVNSVERFYVLLGDRHWVFHGSLNLERLKSSLKTGDSELVEQAVMAQYQDAEKMRFDVMRAQAVPELRPRAELLDLALRDYQDGRYYSVVLLLLSVMDGFVNDVGQQRRGLHTREGAELVAWNSVTAHHRGLAATQRSFTKSFNKTSGEPVFELYRNGIIHGNLTNFDNLIVASKAWNRLFALIDWSQALVEAKKPEKATVTLSESLAKLADARGQQELMDAWTPRSRSVAEHGVDAVMAEPVVQATSAMLDAWKSKNYGRLAPFLHEFMKPKSMNAYFGEVRNRFEGTELEEYNIQSVDLRGPGCAHVKVTLVTNGDVHHSELRWLYVDAEKHVRIETDPRGSWQTIQTEPFSIAERRW
tara:strand:- start:204 stop:1670 length:1467 start_codon:yes stop_codon:yes gene_type:complete